MQLGKQTLVNIFLIFPFFLSLISAFPVPAVEVGEKAPAFELISTQGGKLGLSSFLGKKNVVIQFYVLDFSPG